MALEIEYVPKEKTIFRFCREPVQIKEFPLTSSCLTSCFRTKGKIFLRIIWYISGFPIAFTFCFSIDLIWAIIKRVPKTLGNIFYFLWTNIIVPVTRWTFDIIKSIIKVVFGSFFGRILKILGIALGGYLIYICYEEGYLTEIYELINQLLNNILD